MFAIFCTQSDDIALGVPVLGTLFPPSAVGSLYVLSAMQSLLFNPAGYVLLGLAAAKASAARDERDDLAVGGGAGADRKTSLLWTTLRVLYGLRSNVLVLATLCGLLYRLLVGTPLPWFAAFPLKLLGAPFKPLVYLVGGFSFTLSSMTTLRSVVMPLAVVALKSLCLPIIALLLSPLWQTAPPTMVHNFIWLYALLPCANSALVIARMYAASGGLLAVLTSALALNKTCAFALLFFAGVIAFAADPHALLATKSNLSFVALWASVAGGLLLTIAGALTPAWRCSRGMRTLLVHFLLQLLFALAFVSIQVAARSEEHWDALPSNRPMALGQFPFRFGVVNALRWTTDGSLLLVALDWARCVSAASALGGKTCATSAQKAAPPPQVMPPLVHLGGAVAFGLAMSLPFSLGVAGAPSPRPLDLGTDFWIAYGDEQALVCAVVYGLQCALILVCLLLVAIARRRGGSRDRVAVSEPGQHSGQLEEALLPSTVPPTLTTAEVLGGRRSATLTTAEAVRAVRTERPHSAEELEELQEPLQGEDEPGACDDLYPYSLRIGVMLVARALCYGGQSALCWRLLSESGTEASEASVAIVELMMVLVCLDDGQAFISALLFGLSSLRSARLWQMTSLPPVDPPNAEPTATAPSLGTAAPASASSAAHQQRLLIAHVSMGTDTVVDLE